MDSYTSRCRTQVGVGLEKMSPVSMGGGRLGVKGSDGEDWERGDVDDYKRTQDCDRGVGKLSDPAAKG